MTDLVFLARHGESQLNVRGVVNGDPSVSCGLTPLGEEQARALGAGLAGEEIYLCVTTEFERTRATADLALAGRPVPRLVLPELNEIDFGSFEGGQLADYRAWARGAAPTEPSPGGGESRAAAIGRFVRAYRAILARPERAVLVVAHSLPIRYVLDAGAGGAPAPVMEFVPCAEPYRLEAVELARGLERLEGWLAAPAWGGQFEAP